MKLAHKIGWINTLVLSALSFAAVFFMYAQFQNVLFSSMEREMIQTVDHFFTAPAQSRGLGRSVNNPFRQELIQHLYIAAEGCEERGIEILQDPFGIGDRAVVGMLEVDEGLSYYGMLYLRDEQQYLVVQEATAVVKTLHTMRNWLSALAAVLIVVSFLLGRFAATWSLKPLLLLTGQIRKINTQHLETRFDTQEKTQEIVELKESLNTMLEKIQRGLEIQRRFSSDVAHELRTPVTSIKGYAQLLQGWALEDIDTARESVDAIHQTAQEMSHMIQQLLVLSQMEEEETLPKTELATLPWIEDLKRSLQRRFPDRTFVFSNRAFPERLMTNPFGLYQLIAVFVDNAIAFSEDHLPVNLTFELGKIVIQDFGCGMQEVEIPNLFERFYRIKENSQIKKLPSASSCSGHGLGLSIAREIARKMNLEIQIQSIPDQGTKIIILFPES